MKKRIFLIIFALMIMVVPNVAHGSSGDETVLVVGDTIIKQSLSGYQYLYATTSYLTNNGNRTVTISAKTETISSVDSVYVKAYLQKYDASTSTWIIANSIENTLSSTDYVSVYKDFPVSAGRYRVMSVHKATKNGSTESTTQYTAEKIIN